MNTQRGVCMGLKNPDHSSISNLSKSLSLPLCVSIYDCIHEAAKLASMN